MEKSNIFRTKNSDYNSILYRVSFSILLLEVYFPLRTKLLRDHSFHMVHELFFPACMTIPHAIERCLKTHNPQSDSNMAALDPVRREGGCTRKKSARFSSFSTKFEGGFWVFVTPENVHLTSATCQRDVISPVGTPRKISQRTLTRFANFTHNVEFSAPCWNFLRFKIKTAHNF